MNGEKQSVTTSEIPTEQVSQNPPSKKNKMNKVVLIALGLVLIGAVGYGGYGSKNSKSNSSTTPTNTDANTNKVSTDSKQAADATTTSFHTVGFGTLDRDPKVLIKIAFPENYQAIAYDNGRDTFRSLFGDDKGSFTYHGGSWEIGNPDDGDGRTWGNIGVMGIASDWYTRNGFASYGGFNGDDYASEPTNTTINGYDFSTAKQKMDSLNKLISDTSACAKDAAKGFTISGGFNVCYKPTMIKQAYAAYNPKVELSGYASIKGVPYVLFGYVNIRGGLDDYKDDALDKAGNDFRTGKIPAPTQKNIDALIEALKHSSVASK